MASASQSASPPPNKPTVKKRIRNFTPDERATHRIIEKQRREALNESFLDLARLIPALAPARRLSKSLIVHEGVQYLESQRETCSLAASDVKTLLAENEEILTELNTWRERCGLPPRRPLVISEALRKLLTIDQDILGSFPAGFGDNSTGDDHPNEGGDGQQLDNLQTDVAQDGLTQVPQPNNIELSLQHDRSIQSAIDQEALNLGKFWDAPLAIDNQVLPNNFHGAGDHSTFDTNLPLNPLGLTSFNLNSNTYQDYGMVPSDLDFYIGPANDTLHFDSSHRPQHAHNA